jgi:hypothetical protein
MSFGDDMTITLILLAAFVGVLLMLEFIAHLFDWE